MLDRDDLDFNTDRIVLAMQDLNRDDNDDDDGIKFAFNFYLLGCKYVIAIWITIMIGMPTFISLILLFYGTGHFFFYLIFGSKEDRRNAKGLRHYQEFIKKMKVEDKKFEELKRQLYAEDEDECKFNVEEKIVEVED